MPYCFHCGTQVTEQAVYCSQCGTQQKPGAPRETDFLGSLTPRTASLLCYIPVLGWIPAIAVLASTKFRNHTEVRFHAFQGLYLFVAWLVVDWALSPALRFSRLPDLANLMKVVVFGGWIFMLVKVSQNQTFRLPLLGELADRSVNEQR